MSVSPQEDPAVPPPPPEPGSDLLSAVLDLVRYLRLRCPWDAAQTPRSLLPYLLEEAHEVAHRVEEDDDAALAPELGDLLLHVAFQIVLAEERDAFDAAEVVRLLDDKMRRRHPHLFGLGEQRDWEAIKADERRREAGDGDGSGDVAGETSSLLDGLAPGLDPLSRAQRIQDRVSAVGFDWEDARGAFEKVGEEVEEVRQALEAADTDPAALEDEIGDLLFASVNLARLAQLNGGLALRAANHKFERRFRHLERLARERGLDLEAASLDEMEALWVEAKRLE